MSVVDLRDVFINHSGVGIPMELVRPRVHLVGGKEFLEDPVGRPDEKPVPDRGRVFNEPGGDDRRSARFCGRVDGRYRAGNDR
jgi:hypothetical protein